MLVRPSGGLVYHWRALRHRHAWQPFRQQIESWLSTWEPRCRDLILIGPSAGYTLPTNWLKRFDSITAYDLDPLAGILFRWLHRGVHVSFRRQDMFWKAGRLSLEPLKTALEKQPDAAILFVNVLGQVLLEGTATEDEWSGFLTALRRELKGRSWASYHDRISVSHGESIDHLTGGPWSDGLKKHEFQWQLTERSQHRIEALLEP